MLDAFFGFGSELAGGSLDVAFALIKLEHAIGMDQAAQIGRGRHRVGLALRQAHQFGLGLDGGGDTVGQAGAPEAEQPRRDLRQIFRAHGERPERIAQPARQLTPHVLGGERHDVGEGKGAGIAAAGFLGNALAVDQNHVPAGFGQLVG